MRQLKKRGDQLGLQQMSFAFYDALTKPQAIKDFYENDELIAITKELADTLTKKQDDRLAERESATSKNAYAYQKAIEKAQVSTRRYGGCCADCYDAV